MKIKHSSKKKVMASSKMRRRNRRNYVKAAESDYIKIGNMVLPKNASEYGYDSYENIQKDTRRRYDDEKRQEAEAKAAAEAKAKGEALYKEASAAANSSNDVMQALFNVLVPRSGAATTEAGELVRAMNRILYRDYNDGDMFFTGYGFETCGPSAAYLIDNTPDSTGIPDKLMDITEYGYISNSDYTAKINEVSDLLSEYVLNTPGLFGQQPKADSRDYSSNTLSEIGDRSHQFEYEIDTSGDLEELIEEYGAASWSDFEYWLEELCRTYGGEVNSWARDGFTIVDLDSEQLDEWENLFFKELESYCDDLHQNLSEDEDY